MYPPELGPLGVRTHLKGKKIFREETSARCSCFELLCPEMNAIIISEYVLSPRGGGGHSHIYAI